MDQKKAIAWIWLPLGITVVLFVINWYLSITVAAWIRYIAVYLLAWALYIAGSLARGSKIDRQMVGLNALLAGIYTFGLVMIIAGMITSNAPIFKWTDGHPTILLDILGIYALVLLTLDLLAVAFTHASKPKNK